MLAPPTRYGAEPQPKLKLLHFIRGKFWNLQVTAFLVTFVRTSRIRISGVVISRPWSGDSSDSSSFCPGLGLGLETWWPRSQSWSRDLKKGLDNNTEDIHSGLEGVKIHKTVSFLVNHGLHTPSMHTAYSKCWNNHQCNEHLNFPCQQSHFLWLFQTFPYLRSFSMIFQTWKISTLNSMTFQTFPGSVRTLFCFWWFFFLLNTRMREITSDVRERLSWSSDMRTSPTPNSWHLIGLNISYAWECSYFINYFTARSKKYSNRQMGTGDIYSNPQP